MKLFKILEKKIREARNRKFDSAFESDSWATLQVKNLERLVTDPVRHEPLDLAIYSTYCGAGKNKTYVENDLKPGIGYYFISNNEDILREVERRGWHPIFLGLPVTNNLILSAQQSKVAKAMPQIFPQLKVAKKTLYVDDKLKFSTDKVQALAAWLEESTAPMAMREHPFLSGNVLNELCESMWHKRYQSQRGMLVDFITRRVDSGDSLSAKRMFLTGTILRNMQHSQIQEINERWYQYILECGIECQISFHFVAQKHPEILSLHDSLI